MKNKLTIALVAHDKRKADMVDWACYNADYLSRQHLVCTGTTGSLIKNAFDEMGIPSDITCMNSGRWVATPRSRPWSYATRWI